ncbi:MAG: hypothetical protein QW318_07130 [Candidatus Caldarchaeum sp.]
MTDFNDFQKNEKAWIEARFLLNSVAEQQKEIKEKATRMETKLESIEHRLSAAEGALGLAKWLWAGIIAVVSTIIYWFKGN